MGRGTKKQLDALAKIGLAPEGYYGLVGELDRLKGPITEASRVWMAANLLTMYGNLLGRKAFIKIGPKRHYGNIAAVACGLSGGGGKGQGTDEVGEVMDIVDPDRPIRGGLATGQGIIYHLRDPNPEKEDPGAPEKRALCVEEEFSSLLTRCVERGSILSQTVRKAWDGSKLENLTMTTHTVATGHTVSIIGHITREELIAKLTSTDQANGFGNRFMFFWVARQKLIAIPQQVGDAALNALAAKLKDALDWLDNQKEVEIVNGEPEVRAEFYFDAQTTVEYQIAYSRLRRERAGIIGAMTARAATQVLKMALIYAAMDKSRAIRIEHLFAAKAVWDYVEKSTELIFDDTTGNPLADQIRGWLRDAGRAGMSRSTITRANNNHAEGIEDALDLLRGQEIARSAKVKSRSGPATEMWWFIEDDSLMPTPPVGTRTVTSSGPLAQRTTGIGNQAP